MNCKVYSAYGKKLVFEGTDGECWKCLHFQFIDKFNRRKVNLTT